MGSDDRTTDMALMPAEREMSAEAWAEYGGLPPRLRGYCFRLMSQEGDARVRVRVAELEVAEWRELVATLRARAEAAEKRAEAAEARAAQAEATGYRRAIDEACAALGARCDSLAGWVVEDDSYNAGRLRGLDLAEDIVRALAPVEPVSKADELPGGAA